MVSGFTPGAVSRWKATSKKKLPTPPQPETLTSKKRGAELLGIDGRAPQHPEGIATVAAFRPWRSSQTHSH